MPTGKCHAVVFLHRGVASRLQLGPEPRGTRTGGPLAFLYPCTVGNPRESFL